MARSIIAPYIVHASADCCGASNDDYFQVDLEICGGAAQTIAERLLRLLGLILILPTQKHERSW